MILLDNDLKLSHFKFNFVDLFYEMKMKNNEISKYIDELEELSRDYLELEQITNSPLVKKYPNEYTIDGLRVDMAAEDVANQERKRLGLGDGPIPILRDVLEQDVGLRIFYLSLSNHPNTLQCTYMTTN